jgi:hypothetical protein
MRSLGPKIMRKIEKLSPRVTFDLKNGVFKGGPAPAARFRPASTLLINGTSGHHVCQKAALKRERLLNATYVTTPGAKLHRKFIARRTNYYVIINNGQQLPCFSTISSAVRILKQYDQDANIKLCRV